MLYSCSYLKKSDVLEVLVFGDGDQSVVYRRFTLFYPFCFDSPLGWGYLGIARQVIPWSSASDRLSCWARTKSCWRYVWVEQWIAARPLTTGLFGSNIIDRCITRNDANPGFPSSTTIIVPPRSSLWILAAVTRNFVTTLTWIQF